MKKILLTFLILVLFNSCNQTEKYVDAGKSYKVAEVVYSADVQKLQNELNELGKKTVATIKNATNTQIKDFKSKISLKKNGKEEYNYTVKSSDPSVAEFKQDNINIKKAGTVNLLFYSGNQKVAEKQITTFMPEVDALADYNYNIKINNFKTDAKNKIYEDTQISASLQKYNKGDGKEAELHAFEKLFFKLTPGTSVADVSDMGYVKIKQTGEFSVDIAYRDVSKRLNFVARKTGEITKEISAEPRYDREDVTFDYDESYPDDKKAIEKISDYGNNDWVQVKEYTKKLGRKTRITFHIEKNETKDTRSATFYFKDKDGNPVYKIILKQNAKTWLGDKVERIWFGGINEPAKKNPFSNIKDESIFWANETPNDNFYSVRKLAYARYWDATGTSLKGPVFAQNKDDSGMCWAMGSVNLIHWWIDKNRENINKYFDYKETKEPGFKEKYGKYLLYKRYEVGDGYEKEAKKSEIANLFRSRIGNLAHGGDEISGVRWFLTGKEYSEKPSYSNDRWQGLFSDVISPDDTEMFIPHVIHRGMAKNDLKKAIEEIKNRGNAFALILGKIDSSGNEYVNWSHVISCWGAAVNKETGNVEALYVVEVNDAKNRIDTRTIRYTKIKINSGEFEIPYLISYDGGSENFTYIKQLTELKSYADKFTEFFNDKGIQ